MVNKFKNISVISTGSWVPSEVKDEKNKIKTYKILIDSLVLDASIGIHDFEKKQKQKLSISLNLDVEDNISKVEHNIDNFVSYEYLVRDIKKLISSRHIELLETLGEEIIDICFKDERVFAINLKLEKLEVFREVSSVGIEVFRKNPKNSRKY
tara:strand:+ start:508 stop:966 length:459 start_codon:yes stop_codon:yes gene_type:complete